MSKSWYMQCQTGLCFNGGPTTWCESFYPSGCQGGDVGVAGIEDLTSAEIEASTAKFYGTRDKDGNLLLEEAGFLAAAGLRAGDTLVGINSLRYSDEKERQQILLCKFPSAHIVVRFRYATGLLEQAATIPNPAYASQDTDKEP